MTDDIHATPKSEAIDSLLTALTGRSRVQTIEDHKCMTCNKPAEHFRDSLSLKEYTISGMCQECQDSVFGIEDYDTDDDIDI